jgi:hypothetical protein
LFDQFGLINVKRLVAGLAQKKLPSFCLLLLTVKALQYFSAVLKFISVQLNRSAALRTLLDAWRF